MNRVKTADVGRGSLRVASVSFRAASDRSWTLSAAGLARFVRGSTGNHQVARWFEPARGHNPTGGSNHRIGPPGRMGGRVPAAVARHGRLETSDAHAKGPHGGM